MSFLYLRKFVSSVRANRRQDALNRCLKYAGPMTLAQVIEMGEEFEDGPEREAAILRCLEHQKRVQTKNESFVRSAEKLLRMFNAKPEIYKKMEQYRAKKPNSTLNLRQVRTLFHCVQEAKRAEFLEIVPAATGDIEKIKNGTKGKKRTRGNPCDEGEGSKDESSEIGSSPPPKKKKQKTDVSEEADGDDSGESI